MQNKLLVTIILAVSQNETSSRNLAQHTSTHQVNYKPKTNSTYHKTNRTPLSVGLALTAYQTSRSMSDIETLLDMQFSATYDDVLRMTTRMAISVIGDVKHNTQGVYVQAWNETSVSH